MEGMRIFDKLAEYRHEQLVLCHDHSTGLRAVIAVHDTTLGPALGGCRMWPYESEEEAIVDALRLARGMTYKAAVSGLDFGGGKSVIIGDPREDKSEALFRSFGRYVETLGGRYVAAEDVGTSTEDMDRVRLETSHVAGVSPARGGSGDPSPFTALGVLQGMRACVEELFGTTSLKGRTVAVQGLGHVGHQLCRLLDEAGAKLLVADIVDENVERVVRETGAEALGIDEILSASCDVLAPCAMGAVVDDGTLPHFQCSIIAGAANNVLQEPRHGQALADRGILYAPDYVINAGGLINISVGREGYDERRATERVVRIYDSARRIIDVSKRDGIPTNVAADALALERIEHRRKNIGPVCRTRERPAGGDGVKSPDACATAYRKS